MNSNNQNCSQKKIDFELQRIINNQLYQDKIISKNMFEVVNNNLLKKIFAQTKSLCEN